MSAVQGERLVDAYDLVIFDLDGVIYLIDRPIPGAVEAVARLHGEGKPLAYATNNASRRPTEVAELLVGLGVNAQPGEVLTSAVASAAALAERFPAGAPVLVVGAEALRAEVRAVGLTLVERADQSPVAVVQGYGPQVGWTELAEASVAIRAGAFWVATNTDRTLPSPRGPLPGNGSLVAVLRTALDREPDLVVGKPESALFGTAARQHEARRPLTVGDRLDTDIEGAGRAGMDSLLVLTGVSRAADLLLASPSSRPTYVAHDLRGLFDADAVVGLHDLPAPQGDPAVVAGGGWQVTVDGAVPTLTGAGRPLDALRLLCALAWSGHPVSSVRPGSDAAGGALRELGLSG
ncbi:HAD-IIA family hydrolase [Micromonospora sp. NBC_01796]|uniref:HAD-IIA family hydrolase n=1 Tax=Micromonospora sp. NBC_01796 TaxID=2975987 RepID=UPI002DD96173|nr:HAD-IIA family hydrolase [Micromonospora sp. NBC_01796]WSA86051.1 HAD-IIA family hydrolase [Micromonospora sp. NBC_01796]